MTMHNQLLEIFSEGLKEVLNVDLKLVAQCLMRDALLETYDVYFSFALPFVLGCMLV